MSAPYSSPLLRNLPLLALLTGTAAGLYFLRGTLSFEALADHREALLAFRDTHYSPSILLFLLAYTAIVAFSLPGGTIATLAGGFLFGTFPGVIFNVLGATLGATLLFLAIRAGFGERLSRRITLSDGPIGRIKRGIDANQWEMLFLIRLVPAVPFFVANILPALLAVPLHRYVITTFFGIVPAALVFTSIGAGLGEVFAAGTRPDLGVILTPQVLGPLLGLAGLAILPIFIKALRGRKGLE